MFQKSFILSAILLVFLMFLSLVVKPFMIKSSATKVLKTVLRQWENKALNNAAEYWINPKAYPEIYDLKDYKVTYTEFKKQKYVWYAEFQVILNFNSKIGLPSGEKWLFSLVETPEGWRIHDFYFIDRKIWGYDPLKKFKQNGSGRWKIQTPNNAKPKEIESLKTQKPSSTQPTFKTIPAALD